MATAWIKAGALAWLEGAPETRRLDTPIFGHPADGCEPLYNQAALDAAVAAEREACARLCEDYSADRHALYKGRSPYSGAEPGRATDYVQGESDGAMSCAERIRARGEQAKDGK